MNRDWNSTIPRLLTPRLALRAFEERDIPALVERIGDARIADTTVRIPHPYTADHARDWLGVCEVGWREGMSANFAIAARDSDQLRGAIGLTLDPGNDCGEVGYWIAVPWWGQGFATEALRATLAFGFDAIGLWRIHAHHLARNPASGRVLAAAGMQREGELRQATRWHGVTPPPPGTPPREDILLYGMLRTDPRR